MIYLITNNPFYKEFNNSDIHFARISDCLEYFKDKEIIEVDSETEYNKRNPKHLPNPYENKVLCFQLGDKDNQFVIDNSSVDVRPLKPLFEDETKIKLFCNAFFDLRFLFHYGFNVKNVYDIFLAECILYKGLDLPKGFRGLDQISQRYLGEEVSKEVRGQIHWRGLDEKVIEYAAGDVTKLGKIREKQLEAIDKIDQRAYLELENRYVLDLSKVSYRGFKLDPKTWMQVNKENIKEAEELKIKLDSWVKDFCMSNEVYDWVDNTLFGIECNIKWTSSDQVKSLFRYLGIDIINKKEDKESVDIKLLKKQLDDDSPEILEDYIKYKELLKEISTYGEDFIKKNINPITKRIHSEFFQILDTSRISSNNPNLQNIPGEKDGETHPLRKAFVPENGNVLIVSDFSQQEPRITAEYSNDPYLIDFILNGDGDSHSLIATMISEYLLGENIKVTKKNNPLVPAYGKSIRAIGKMINLGKDYGKTAFSIKDDLKTTQEEAQKLLDVIDAKTPQKTEYFNQCKKFVKDHGYIISDRYFKSRTNFYGYSEFKKLEEIKYDNRTKEERKRLYKLLGEMERFAQNNPIQNSGAVMTKIAHILFNNWIENNNLQDKVWAVNLVHDEIVSECINDPILVPIVARNLKACMEKAGKYICKKIPMIVEPQITNHWEH